MSARRQWDGHCPECGCDAVDLLLVRKEMLQKRCGECKHGWFEERITDLVRAGNYVWRDA